MTTAAIVAASLPYLDALLDGSRDRLKDLGKDLTGEVVERLHGFWQRLLRVEPKAGDLIRADQDPAQRRQLETLVAEAVARHPDLADLARQLGPLVQSANQSGGLTQVAGEKSVLIGRDFHGNLTIG